MGETVKIVWLGDVQAPYREPMFRELTALVDFSAAFFFREEKVRHWTWRPSPDYPSSLVGCWRVPLPAAIARRLDSPMGLLRPGVARRLVKGSDAVIIQAFWQPANLAVVFWSKVLRKPYMIYAESTLHSRQFGGGLLHAVRSFVFRNAGAVIVPGPAARDAAIHDGAAPDRVVTSVNSVELDEFMHRVRELRDGEAGGPHRFVYVGQLIERKNVAALLRAFAPLAGKATLDIAGDGVLMEPLKALAAELAVADSVHFRGFLDEAGVVELLAECHTLVLPSTEEVYGFTALEAHVAGLQTVVSDVSGIAPNLQDRPGCWVVPPTVEALAEALVETCDQWSGWADDVDAEFASPRRAAQDLVAAAERAARP
ncbi:hypothetical protein GCM10009836_46300 [Pseudonocardia ailaonensis]|uniref:Glycosyl transferase family 1 domain-containing protein n=1 Tax=Pseudonocardia ailaonensis TaxID=367279 RepID=A0ABN2NCZ8_9PSEU